MTQIGFHNWLVAAPSQKAALEAWDVKENLFAIGAAKVVTDEDCIKLALQTPGVPTPVDSKHAFARATKVLRLEDHRAGRRPPAPARETAKKKPAVRKKRKVDRSKLDRAEQALEDFKKRSVRERAAIIRAQRALDQKTEALEQELEAEEERLEELLAEARDHYEAEANA
ncbi:MAG: hypothetical protein IPO30_19770 [Hyphomonadaceae bacterium]|nr:hypothetical protein [Hyphomonadaceae bacterium]MBP9233182.1 hypothetical protein [Hyphomonadaceae bacterium]